MMIGSVAITAFTLVGLPVSCQTARSRDVQLLSVCEILSDLQKYRGKDLAILGRIDCGNSLIDHVCFLAEDRCERPLTIEGHVWPNQVLIVDNWEEGIPKPPTRKPEITQDTLVQKLSLVRRRTKLGLHKEPRFKNKGHTITFSHMADVNDEWAVAYGMLFAASKLRKPPCNDEIGCGGFLGAPVALIITVENLHTLKDDKHQTPSK